MKRLASAVMKLCMQGTKVAAFTFITLNYVGGFVVCYGPSMEPTLKTRDVLLTEHISPRLKRIDIGDVVVARSPQDNRCVCKRVVAGPGDVVLYKNKTITVPDDSVWLEGDNKDNSNDSRFYGPVAYDLIRRRCFCKIWPLFDRDLSGSGKFFLEAAPMTQQKSHHRENKERLVQELPKQSENSLGVSDSSKEKVNSSNDLLGIIKDDGTKRLAT